jgi:hypothetical protein
MSKIHAPDYAEPILAWRVWRYTRGGLLTPMVHRSQEDSWWPKRPLPARCVKGYRVLGEWINYAHQKHKEVPDIDCRCGYYALRRFSSLALQYVSGRDAIFYGVVALWGRIVEHEGGYRAQYAEPRLLFGVSDIFRTWYSFNFIMRDVHNLYGIPVYSVPTKRLSGTVDSARRHAFEDELHSIRYAYETEKIHNLINRYQLRGYPKRRTNPIPWVR